MRPFHLFTLTTVLLISSGTMMPTPLLLPSPPACNSLYPPIIVLALSPFYLVSWMHNTSSLLLSIISTTSTPFPLIVPTFRLPSRTSHLDRCRPDDPLGLRCRLAAAQLDGASVTPDAVAPRSTILVPSLYLGHHSHSATIPWLTCCCGFMSVFLLLDLPTKANEGDLPSTICP